MAWTETVITNSGISLYNEALHGNGLDIVRATGGFSTYPTASLMTQTRVTAPEMNLPIAGIRNTAKGREVIIRVNNIGLESSYILKQVGLYARKTGETGNDTFIAIIQDSRGIEIPAEATNPEFILEFGFLLPLSNECVIHVEIDPSVLATLKDLEDAVEGREPAREVVPQAEAETGTATTVRGWTAQRVNQAVLAVTTAISNTLNSISNTLSSHTGNTNNPHSVTASQAGAEPARTIASDANMRIGTGATIHTMTPALVRAGAAGAALLGATASTTTPLSVTGLPSVTETHLTGRIITIRCTNAINMTAATNIQPSGGTSRALQINGAAVSASNPLTVPASAEMQVRLDGTVYRLISVTPLVAIDTGWIDLVLQNGAVAFGGTTPRYRRIGSRIELAGAIMFPTLSAGISLTFAMLPDGFRPSQTFRDWAVDFSNDVTRGSIFSVFIDGNLQVTTPVTGGNLWINKSFSINL
ncbi:MAG: hypothetical protein FWD48_01260 [Oscillospiraceae bacterium]|nr:hypothetical protein [Oscillospiraceae bacterium]